MAQIIGGVHACWLNRLCIFWIRDFSDEMPHTHWRTRTLQHLSDEMWPVTSPHPTKFKTFQSQHENTVNTPTCCAWSGFHSQAGLVTAADRRMLGKDCKIAETVQLTPSADLSTLKVSMRLPPVSASYGNISAKSFSYNIRLLRIDPLKHGRLREH